MIDLGKGETYTPGFLKLNPAGLIPVIVGQDGPELRAAGPLKNPSPNS